MALLGAHMSIAGGLHKAVQAAASLGMESLQIFTHSPSQWAVQPVVAVGKGLSRSRKSLKPKVRSWAARSLNEDAVRRFQEAMTTSGVLYVAAHDSYLTNLASPQEELFQRSVEAFSGEMERAESLGLDGLVAHPGSHTGTDEATGLANVMRALREILHRCRGYRVRLLLETTAGQGNSLGWRFEHLRALLDGVPQPDQLGVCFDTCHVFAAGYPLSTQEEYHETMETFDKIVGLEQIRLFHMNDSKKGLGSRVDRHENIGRGELGLEAFRLLVNDPRFRDRPMVLETPKEDGGEAMDPVNLDVLRGLSKRQNVGL